MVKIGIITGSTRPYRFGHQPSNWIKSISDKRNDADYEIIDLNEINLPLLDEPNPPMTLQYTKDHSKEWSKLISSFDGFIIISAEYNHSIPAALKNAMDYLYHEWNYKPVAFVSYGSGAGGSRAVEHLRGAVGELKMYDIREQILLANYWNNLNEQGEFQFTDEHEQQAAAMLDQLIVWADAMKPVREMLANKNEQ